MATLDQALVDAPSARRPASGRRCQDHEHHSALGLPSGRAAALAPSPRTSKSWRAATGLSISVTPSGWTVSSHSRSPAGQPRSRQCLRGRAGWGRRADLRGAGAGPGQFASELVNEWFDLRRRWLAQLDGLLEVHGDSMAPALSDGDLVGVRLFEEGDRPRLGEFVAAWNPRRRHRRGEGLGGLCWTDVRLLSTNVAYPHITAPRDRVVVKGRVTGALRMGGWRIPLVGYAEFDQALAQQIDDESDADTTY